jgi:hypothetical protein
MYLIAQLNKIQQRLMALFDEVMRRWRHARQNATKPNAERRDYHAEKQARKGDPTLLGDKEAVRFRKAEQYLGIAERQRQKLITQGVLKVVGGGQNRMITTESLREYLPPKKIPH